MTPSFDIGLLEPLLKRAEETHSDAVVVMHEGELVGTWRFGKPRQLIQTMSVTKSIVNLAIGRLITKGLLLTSIDEPVHTFYPEWKQGRKKNITIRHIMNHMSGLQNEPRADIEIYPSPDFVQLALCAELAHEPGARLVYNNKAVNLLTGIVERVCGQKLDVLMDEDIFVPLGIEQFEWEKDSVGNPHAMAGLELFPEDLAKLGQLVLNRGKWGNEQVIDASWFDLVESQNFGEIGLLWWLVYDVTITVNDTHVRNLQEANVSEEVVRKLETLEGEHALGSFHSAFQNMFGASWGEVRESLADVKYRNVAFGEFRGYRAEGYLGQHLYVFPKENLVFVRMIGDTSYEAEQDSFNDFENMIKEVVNSL